MKSTNLLVKRLAESDVFLTDNPYEAMYILADGRLISGNFDYGQRGDDHRAIFAGVDYGDYYLSPNTNETHWKRLHREYKVVRLVPETELALIKVGQKLTPDQTAIINEIGFEVEEY